MLHFAGKDLQGKVCEVVREMWRRAAHAQDGEEAEEWPAEWKVGMMVPLWKEKCPRFSRKKSRATSRSLLGSITSHASMR